MRLAVNLRGLKEAFFEHIYLRRKQLLLLCFLFVVGLITGIITITQLTKTFSVNDVADLLLIKSFRGQVGVFSFFIKRFLDYVIMVAIVVGLGFFFFTSFLIYPILFFRGYQIGVTVAVCAAVYGAGGILNILFIYLPVQLILNFVFINCCAVCTQEAWLKRKHGRGHMQKNFTYIFITIALLFAFCLIESLLVPTIFRKIILTI